MEVIMEARDLHFQYEDGTPALQGVSVQIRKGRKIALMGANGSGKSTFFLCLNGIKKPKKGQLFFHGSPLSYHRKALHALRQKVGIIFQDPDNQLFAAGVLQEISFGLLNLGLAPDKAREKTERIIQELEITDFRNKPVHALSGGQKKQISIADILVMEPEVVLLDEPFSALDPRHCEIVLQQMDAMTSQGITLLTSTHDVDFACSWADEIMLFHEGRLLANGSPEEIFTQNELLSQAHLKPPASYELFETLCHSGYLSSDLHPPKNLDTLKEYMRCAKENL